MTDKIEITLFNPQQAHVEMKTAWDWAKSMLMAGHKLTMTIKAESRSNAQNRKMWSCLADISKQVVWYGQKLSQDDWKHILTASQIQQRSVPSVDGGFVVLGKSTSKMTIGEMTELIEIAIAFGTERGVHFHDEG